MKSKKFLSLLFSLLMLFLSVTIYYPEKANALAPTFERLAGGSRYETAIEISKSGWGQSDTVVLATGENFPDALCAAPLAKKYKAPILLNGGDNLNTKVSEELIRLKAKEIFIIGGTGAVPEHVKQQLAAMGLNCTRIFGNDRYETSIKVAEKLGDFTQIVVATGVNYPDALSIAPIAADKGIPIILTGKDSTPQCVKDYLSGKNVTASYIVGGLGVINDDVYKKLPNPERIFGNDRYETNAAIIQRFAGELRLGTTYIATGEDFPDALSGAALASLTKSPIILTAPAPYAATLDLMKTILPSITRMNILGGEGVVLPQTVTAVLYGGTYYTLLNEGNYEYTGTYTIKNDGRTDIYDVNFEVNMGSINGSPYQENETIEISGPGANIVTDALNNKKAVINLSSIKSGQRVEYKITRKFLNGGIIYNADLSKTSGGYSGFKDYATYTSAEDKIESDNALIINKAAQIIQGESNQYLKAKKIFEYVNTSLSYDFSEANKGALNALSTGKGVCEDFSDLFAAMSRSVGIPARVVSGYWMQDLDFTGTVDLSSYRHAWPEFYLPEYGWIAAEPTFIKTSYNGKRIPAYEVFANLPEPGHFVTGYSNKLGYSIKYKYSGELPVIKVITGEYIRKN